MNRAPITLHRWLVQVDQHVKGGRGRHLGSDLQSAYVGDGLNRWSAVPRLNVPPVYRRAIEQGAAGPSYQAVAEDGVTLRAIAEAIGHGLGVPVAAIPPEATTEHFGGLAFAITADLSASSTITQQRLGWPPSTRRGFTADLERSTAYRA